MANYSNALGIYVALAGAALAASLLVVVSEVKPARAAFPGENGRIAFHSFRNGDDEIFTTNPNGTGTAQLTRNTANDVYPAYSAGGRTIAFASDRSGNWDIFTMGVDGARQLRVTRSKSADTSPAWAPDGRALAFSSNRSGNGDIYAIDRNRSGLRRLTTHPASDIEPAWSPDGTRIAFARGGDIFVMRATRESAANRPQRLTMDGRRVSDRDPVWSPDGTRIAFVRRIDIFMVNADGSGLMRLNRPRIAVYRGVAWSPDGNRVAFSGHRRGTSSHEVYVMRAAPESADNRAVRLTRNRVFDLVADWQPRP